MGSPVRRMPASMQDTIFPADSVEFCPDPRFTRNFVCGTYKLEDAEDRQATSDPVPKAPQRRRGTCLLYDVGDDLESLTLKQCIELSAVLDCKSHEQRDSGPLLAIAESEGRIVLNELSAETHRIVSLQTIQCASEETLCLSLDWSGRRQNRSPGSLVTSLSNGSLSVLRPDVAGYRQTETWHAHDFEPWIAAWNYWDNGVLYSGGDDCKMKIWDIRIKLDRPVSINKSFDAGVTTIQSNPHVEHLVAVGSYDSSVRLFDMRKPLTPIVQIDVGGGAWRVKWHPQPARSRDLLVACMHDGFKILRFGADTIHGDPVSVETGYEKKGNNEEDHRHLITRFDKHGSLAYGVDWSFSPRDADEDTLIGSCSFYDHLLHMWRG